MSSSILQVDNLKVDFDTSFGTLQALSGVSFHVNSGEIFGVVGESGCGKSITGLSILGLLPRSGRITEGKIRFRQEDLLAKSEKQMRRIRGEEITMIFQDPQSSLNPVFQVGEQLVRVLREHYELAQKEAREKVLRTLESVGLPDPDRVFNAYPHELSGGMQQRVMISMALLCQPALLIADEPTTALDVTIQAQILRLLRKLRDDTGIAIMLITHDMGVVAQMCERMAVFYAGRVVETGHVSDVFADPQHPYTRGLMAAIPGAAQRGSELTAIPGTVPDNPGAVKGCAFASRCLHVMDRCTEQRPELREGVPGHYKACFLNEGMV